MRYFLNITLFIFSILVYGALPAQAEPLQTSAAKQAILVDYETGDILFEKNAKERMATSSMSKVMSMYAIFDALKTDRMSLDQPIRISEKAWRKGGSKMFIEVNKDVKVEDLIRGVIIQSGNDATIALAEGLSGSEDSFANLLNVKAQELGMKDSMFQNASGWPDDNHYSTAYDLAILAKHIISDFPEYYSYYAETEFTYNDIRQENRNPLLYRNMGVDGIKTGHTNAGGYGLMASGVREGRRVVMVVNGLDSLNARAQEGARLMNWGLDFFENAVIYDENEVVGSASIIMGKTKEINFVAQKEIKVSLPRSMKNDIKVRIDYHSPLIAPIEKGTQIATLHLTIPQIGEKQYPLFAGDNVEKRGFVGRTFEKIGLMIKANKPSLEM